MAKKKMSNHETAQNWKIPRSALFFSVDKNSIAKWCSVHEQLHTNTSQHVVPLRVLNVFCPSPAPDLNDHPRLDIPELKPNQGRDIVVLVVVRIIIPRETLPWGVSHLPQPFPVSLCVPLTRQPNHTQLRAPVCFVPLTAMFPPSRLNLLF